MQQQGKPYGTARAGGKGDKLKAKPVTVAIDTNEEIIEEVEEKDVSLYGVEGLVTRRVSNHEMVMKKSLEKSFFACAAAHCEVFTTKETAIEKIVEAAVQQVENTKNEYVDGVPREYISVTLNTTAYGELAEYFDKVQNPGDYNTATGKVRVFHNVKCYSSTDLPAGVKFIVMVDGAVAQPVSERMQRCKNSFLGRLRFRRFLLSRRKVGYARPYAHLHRRRAQCNA
ncbi:MAG: hypothetical protein ACLRSW_00100 [Christensenellaceae bacterium]